MVRVEHVQLSTYTARILAFSHLHMCNEHVLRLEIAMYKSNRRYLVDMGYGRRYLCQDPHLLRRTRVLPHFCSPEPAQLLMSSCKSPSHRSMTRQRSYAGACSFGAEPKMEAMKP